MAETKKTNFENINDLIKAIIWPVIILIIFICYGSEINKILRLIPKKLESSSKISVGSLSFEIEKTAKNSGNAELADIIKNLSEKGIRKLLSLSSGYYSVIVRQDQLKLGIKEQAYSVPNDIDILKELEKNGLIKATEPIDDFISFFKSLKPDENILYKNSTGSYSPSQSDSFNIRYIELTLTISKLNAADNQRIDRYGVELSETGKKAFDIIVHVIAEQISGV